MEISLKGQTILVTGGSRGIGAEVVRQLAKAGAQVAVHYHTRKREADTILKATGAHGELFRADLSDPVQTIGLFEQVIGRLGSLNCLINNAGVALSSRLNQDDRKWIADWDTTVNVNLRATGLLCKKAIGHFLETGAGRIINIASRAAFRGDTADYLAYAASKGGVVALTRSIARAYGKQNIKAFTIAPGFVRTDMAQEFMDQYGEAYALNDIALDRLTTPEDLAPTIVFLTSGMADHATGCTIDVNAGSYVH